MTPPRSILVIVLVLASFGAPAAAEESEEVVAARLHDRRGQELFDAGDFEGALREMEAAQAVMPSASRLYNMAVCNEQLGNRQAAIDFYQQFIADPSAPEGRRQRAEQQVQRLREEIAAGTGSSAPTEGDQGDAGDEATAEPGDEGEGATGEGGAGGTEAWSEPRPRQRLSPAAFYAMLGVTAASGVALIALGAVALDTEGEYEAEVRNCSAERTLVGLEEEGRTYALVADVMLGITSAAALTTVILAVFTRFGGGGSASRPTLSGGPGLVGLSGSF